MTNTTILPCFYQEKLHIKDLKLNLIFDMKEREVDASGAHMVPQMKQINSVTYKLAAWTFLVQKSW